MNEETKYAVVDLETTGTDLQGENRIIQIGVAFVQSGTVIKKYSTDVNPQMNIPAAITKLTGIDNQRVFNAPIFENLAGKIYSMLQGCVFVAHNVDFDFPFLNKELERSGYPALDISAVDTVSLSQILFPGVRGYRLRDLTHYLGIEHDDPHSADSDADATAELFINLQKKLIDLPIITLECMARIGHGLPRQTHELITHTLEQARLNSADLPADLDVISGLAIKKDNIVKTKEMQEKRLKYPQSKAAKLKMYPDDLKWRKTQSMLMNYIYQQFNDPNVLSDNLVVEAPTGMGKTLGYLVPLWFVAQNTQNKVVISVPTTILQNQIINQSVPVLSKIVGRKVNAVVIKGGNNYLSLTRFSKLIKQKDNFSRESGILAMKILVWLLETSRGDLDEINSNLGFSNFIDQVRHTGDSELDKKSPFYGHDFYRKNRAEEQYADFLITNHSYLINNPDHFKTSDRHKPFLVLDEAQHFVEIAQSSQDIKLDLNALMATTHHVVSKLVMNHGENIFNTFEMYPNVTFRVRRFANMLESCNSKIMKLQHQLFISDVKRQSDVRNDNQPFDVSINSSSINNLAISLTKMNDDLAGAFIEFESADDLLTNGNQFSKDQLQRWNEIKISLQRLSEQMITINSMVTELKQQDGINWITVGPNHDEGSIRIAHGTLNPANLFQSKIQANFKKVLLIGGSLFAGHNRNYFLDNFNFKDNVTVHSFNSGINFSEQLDLEVVSDDQFSMDNITNSTEYENYLKDAIYHLTSGMNRQTLVLFNSLETVEHVYSLLRKTDLGTERRILAQGIHGSNAKIVREFNDEDDSILLGAASFWEGVDFPGDRLELLIMTKLPFRSPDDKYVQNFNRTHGSTFRNFILPDAILRFKQGIGRVIRNSDDRGAVVLLDDRLVTRKYGKQFINALPQGVSKNEVNLKQARQNLIDFFRQ